MSVRSEMRKVAVRMMMPRMAPALSTASFLAMLIDCVKFMFASSYNDLFVNPAWHGWQKKKRPSVEGLELVLCFYLERLAALWSRMVRNSESLAQFGQSFDSARSRPRLYSTPRSRAMPVNGHLASHS